MADKEKRGNYSILVLMMFLVAFLLFAFLNKPGTPSKSITPTGAFIGVQQSSSLTIGITLAIIIIIGIVGFFFFKSKMKNKVVNENIANKNLNLSEEQIDKLFTEDKSVLPLFNSKKETSAIGNEPIEISGNENKDVEVTPIKQEFKSDDKLKNKLLELINNKMPSQKILDILSKLGYRRKQIDDAVDGINIERLSNFINKALKQGHKKEAIVKALLKKNWQGWQINKAFNKDKVKEKPSKDLDLDLI